MLRSLFRAACNVIGNVYPAYASYKAVLSRDPEQHKQWLCYWVVNAIFVVLELVGDTFISWLPLYYESKLALIVWLTFYRGATVLYDNLVHKYLEQYEPEIDAKLLALQSTADAALDTLRARAVSHIRHGGQTIFQAGGAALAELAMVTAAAAPSADIGAAAASATPLVDTDTVASSAGNADDRADSRLLRSPQALQRRYD